MPNPLRSYLESRGGKDLVYFDTVEEAMAFCYGFEELYKYIQDQESAKKDGKKDVISN